MIPCFEHVNQLKVVTVILSFVAIFVLGEHFAKLNEKEADLKGFAAKLEAVVEKTQNETHKIPYLLQAFDPFALWSRRDQVSKETISAILKSVDRDSLCYKNSVSTPINALEQVALAIRKKFPEGAIVPGQLIFAVIGDSVAADVEGFVDALQSFLTLSLNIPFPVEVRNYAHGGKGPRYFSICNDLHGDEDVVLFENVRPYEAGGVLNLANSLVSSGYGVILYNWRAVRTWYIESRFIGFGNASDTFGLPLFTFPAGRERIKESLPANANFSLPEEKLIYRDETHPNRLGELILATMIGQLFEDAARLCDDMNLDWNEVETKRLSHFEDNPAYLVHDALCFSQLNCTAPPAIGEAFGNNLCLNVKSVDGFEKKSLSSGKVWWQGTQPGHSIEIIMPGTCSEIYVFHNLRVTNGMVRVQVDGLVPEGPLINGILDGWFEGFSWLRKDRGHNVETVIATDLPKAEQHAVRLTVLNKTNSEDDTYKFDFTAMACSK